MKGNKNDILGMDQWELYEPLDYFLQVARGKGWSVYEVKQKDDRIRFYAPVLHRKEIERTFSETITYIRTSGMLGFLFRQGKQPYRVLCLLVCLGLWYGLSHTIFDVTIQGDKQESKEMIQQTLNELGYQTPFYDTDMQAMKAVVKKRLENNIAWLEVSKEGSQYHIQFTTKEFATLEALGRDELIAQKDGVIAKFDVLHGNKLVALNTFVHKGDVLVSNILVDSKNTDKEVYVKGKVYAYTWKDVHVEMSKNDLPKPFQFFQLLFEARNEASKNLNREETIHKENILQFSDNTGTISMDVHYTLYEDITTP